MSTERHDKAGRQRALRRPGFVGTFTERTLPATNISYVASYARAGFLRANIFPVLALAFGAPEFLGPGGCFPGFFPMLLGHVLCEAPTSYFKDYGALGRSRLMGRILENSARVL